MLKMTLMCDRSLNDLKIIAIISVVLFSGLLISQAEAVENKDVMFRMGSSSSSFDEIAQITKLTGLDITTPLNITAVFPQPNYNATWQYREHNRGGSDTGFFVVINCSVVNKDSRCEDSENGIEMLDLDNSGNPASEATGSDWYLFKSFNYDFGFSEDNPALFWHDRDFDFEREFENLIGGSTVTEEILFFDGTYDRASNTDFPNGQPIALKGAGLLQQCHVRTTTSFGGSTVGCNPTLMKNSTTGSITVMYKRQQCDGCSGYTRIADISFREFALWDFRTLENTIVRELEGTTGDFGTVTAGDYIEQVPYVLEGIVGSAIDPTTNEIYIVFEPSNTHNFVRLLHKLNPVTGTTTHVAHLPAEFDAIEFDDTGQLKAVCGHNCQGGSPTFQLGVSDSAGNEVDEGAFLLIDKTTGRSIKQCTFRDQGIPDDKLGGSARLVFDFDNLDMYVVGSDCFNCGGFGSVNFTYFKIDNESTCANTEIAITGHTTGKQEVGDIVYDTLTNVFYGIFSAELGGGNPDNSKNDYWNQTLAGFRTLITSSPHGTREMQGLELTFDIPDTLAPAILKLGIDPFDPDAEFDVDQFTSYNDAGATCLDETDGDLTSSIVTVNPVDINESRQYIVSYDCQDVATNNAVQKTRTVNVLDKEAPVVTIIGNSPIEIVIGGTFVDQGATALDNIDGDVTASIITTNPVNTCLVDAYFVLYDVTDSAGNAGQGSRTVIVVSAPSVGGGGGSPSSPPTGTLTEEEQEEIDIAFDVAVDELIAQIPPQDISDVEIVIESLIQTFFEFAVVDDTHDDLTLNSFLDNERLGIRWSSGQNIVIASAIPSPSPFLITFEQLPTVKQGSGAVVSTDFLLYNLQVPRNECGAEITTDCVLKVRYEIPVTINAVINGTNVSDVGTITVDLVDELIDPILVLLLATFGIPIVGVVVQRARGRNALPPVRDVFRT